MNSELSVRCGAKTKAGTPCKQWAIQGGTRCRKHGGAAPQVRAKAEVRAEVMRWGLGEATVDPGEVLLRLVTQSTARAQHYADLLQDAFEAAERLSKSTIASDLAKKFDSLVLNTEQSQALCELDEVFSSGGVSALVGKTWGAVKDLGVYATGEAIRGLAKLEAEERDRCANFASKAIAAGLNERMVRVAERQGEMLAGMVTAALAEAALPPEMAQRVRASIARQVRELSS